MIVLKAVKPPKSIPDINSIANGRRFVYNSVGKLYSNYEWRDLWLQMLHIYFPRTLMKVIPKETLEYVVLKYYLVVSISLEIIVRRSIQFINYTASDRGLFTTAWESCRSIQIRNDVTFDFKCCALISRGLRWKLYQKKL